MCLVCSASHLLFPSLLIYSPLQNHILIKIWIFILFYTFFSVLHGFSADLFSELFLLTSCPRELTQKECESSGQSFNLCSSNNPMICLIFFSALKFPLLRHSIQVPNRIQQILLLFLFLLLSDFSASWIVCCLACSALPADQVPPKNKTNETNKKTRTQCTNRFQPGASVVP